MSKYQFPSQGQCVDQKTGPFLITIRMIQIGEETKVTTNRPPDMNSCLAMVASLPSTLSTLSFQFESNNRLYHHLLENLTASE